MQASSTAVELDDYIREFCEENDLSYFKTRDMFSTPHRYLKVCRNPPCGTLPELLELSKRLNVRPLYLYGEFEFASDTLSILELQLLKDADEKTRRITKSSSRNELHSTPATETI